MAPSAPNSAIRAVAFDCFGVLYEDAYKVLVEAHAHDNSPHPPQYYYDLARAADRGQISDHDFYAELEQLSGEAAATIRRHLHDVSVLNQPVIDIIKQLKPHYRTGVLSNAQRGFLDHFLAAHQLKPLFDAVVASSDTPYLKPERGIFEIAATRLGVSFSELLFIDDSPRHTTAATGYGLASITYESPQQLRADLVAQGILP